MQWLTSGHEAVPPPRAQSWLWSSKIAVKKTASIDNSNRQGFQQDC